MATRKTKHPPKGEQRRRLTMFFNKDARKSAADALKKVSWLLAAANAYLGFAKESVAYLAVVIVGWLVAHLRDGIALSDQAMINLLERCNRSPRVGAQGQLLGG